jgi:hypothetical protein
LNAFAFAATVNLGAAFTYGLIALVAHANLKAIDGRGVFFFVAEVTRIRVGLDPSVSIMTRNCRLLCGDFTHVSSPSIHPNNLRKHNDYLSLPILHLLKLRIQNHPNYNLQGN